MVRPNRGVRGSVAGLLALMMVGMSAGRDAAAAAPVHLDGKGERWAQATLRRMTLEEKIGQMIMVWAFVKFLNVDSTEYKQLRVEMDRYHVGGFGATIPSEGPVLFKSEPLEAAVMTNALQRDSKYPLMFAADFERGLATRFEGSTGFPAAMAFGAAGDVKLAREFGRISADEARAVGIQWNWYPVADVNSNAANPIINTRSFGEDPAAVSELVDAYIEGARADGMLTTVKHFPGHGDTDTDSHLSLARISADRARLDRLELVPFRSAIAAGVDSVMIGHIAVPALEPDPDKPASISEKIVTGLLKNELGFRGLVVTDALDMGALMQVFPGTDAEKSGAEAVQAVLAGNDMVIIPADLDGTFRGLVAAVKDGRISQARIDASVLKILRMKASVGLDRNRFVDVAAVDREVGRAANMAVAQAVADKALTLVVDQHGLLPLRVPAAHVAAVVFTDDGRATEGSRVFVRELSRRAPDARVIYTGGEHAEAAADEVAAAVKEASVVIAFAESVPSPRRVSKGSAAGSAGLDAGATGLLQAMVKMAPEKVVFAAFGNPYNGLKVPGIETYVCTFSNTPNSAASLVSGIFGEIAIHGRLPVSLPGIGARGAGLDRDAAPRNADK